MTNNVIDASIRPAYKCKFVVERTPKNVDLTMLVRKDNQEFVSRTLMTAHHATTLADGLEQNKDCRIVLGDGAGSVELRAPGADLGFQFVIVVGKAGSLEGFCDHGDQRTKLIAQLREMVEELDKPFKWVLESDK